MLDEVERDRYYRLARASDRGRFLGGRFLARTILAELLDEEPSAIALDATCPTCGRPHGKPRLVGDPFGDLDVSVAHADELVLAGYARGAKIGVDVEPAAAASRLVGLAAHVLAPEERHEVDALPVDRQGAALLRYWTRKEAILKATAEGLPGDMTTLRLSRIDEPPAVIDAPTRPAFECAISLADVNVGDGYVASVALWHPKPT